MVPWPREAAWRWAALPPPHPATRTTLFTHAGRLAHLLKPTQKAGEVLRPRRGGPLKADPALAALVDRLV